MPGTSAGWVLPTCNPWAGTCPPLPGSLTIANATGSPASTSTGIGHHVGTVSNPSASGRSLNTASWI